MFTNTYLNSLMLLRLKCLKFQQKIKIFSIIACDDDHFDLFRSAGKDRSDRIFFGKLQTIAKWSANKVMSKKWKKKIIEIFIDPRNRSWSKNISIDRFFLSLFWRSDRINFSLINRFRGRWSRIWTQILKSRFIRTPLLRPSEKITFFIDFFWFS